MLKYRLGRLLILLFAVGLFCTATLITVSARVYRSESRVVATLSQHIGDGNRILPCKQVKELNKQLLEASVEKYRKGESGTLVGLFYCREAFSTLRKYALDPDPNVRKQITGFLGVYYSPEALQLLVRQIETYPLSESAVLYHYIARYPCYVSRKVKVRSLTQTLAVSIKTRDDEVHGNEIRILGCLSTKYPEARRFLEEASQPSFPTHLSESDRRDQLNILTYALAEAGSKESEEKVLADIEAAAAGDRGAVQSALDKVKGFTNCRIIQALARFILDKRAVTLDTYDEGKIKQVEMRIGDMAISTFTGALGTQVTDEDDVGWKPHTDAEMERIFERVKKALQRRKFSTCS